MLVAVVAATDRLDPGAMAAVSLVDAVAVTIFLLVVLPAMLATVAVLHVFVFPTGYLRGYRYIGYKYGLNRRHGLAMIGLSAPAIVASYVSGGSTLAVILSAVYVFGVLGVTVGVANRPVRRLLARARTAPDGGAFDGPAIISGSACVSEDTAPLVAPVSGRPALAYTAHVIVHSTSWWYRQSQVPFTVDYAVDAVPFDVETDHGSVTVDPTGAWLPLATISSTPGWSEATDGDATRSPWSGVITDELVVEAGDSVPDRLLETESPVGDFLPVDADGSATETIRVAETVIEPDDPVVIAGEAEPDQEFGNRRLRCDRPGAFLARGDGDEVVETLERKTGRWVGYAGTLSAASGLGLIVIVLA